MQSSKNKKEKKIVIDTALKKKAIRLLLKMAFFIVIIYIIFFKIFGLMKIDSNMMRPSMMGGDLALVLRVNGSFENGDVVIYERDGKRYVGRIIACENDVVELDDTGAFIINGGVDNTVTYTENMFPNKQSISYPYKLVEKQLFIVGDNRGDVDDSRSIGGIFESEIKGKIIGIFRSHEL